MCADGKEPQVSLAACPIARARDGGHSRACVRTVARRVRGSKSVLRAVLRAERGKQFVGRFGRRGVCFLLWGEPGCWAAGGRGRGRGCGVRGSKSVLHAVLRAERGKQFVGRFGRRGVCFLLWGEPGCWAAGRRRVAGVAVAGGLRGAVAGGLRGCCGGGLRGWVGRLLIAGRKEAERFSLGSPRGRGDGWDGGAGWDGF